MLGLGHAPSINSRKSPHSPHLHLLVSENDLGGTVVLSLLQCLHLARRLSLGYLCAASSIAHSPLCPQIDSSLGVGRGNGLNPISGTVIITFLFQFVEMKGNYSCSLTTMISHPFIYAGSVSLSSLGIFIDFFFRFFYQRRFTNGIHYFY